MRIRTASLILGALLAAPGAHAARYTYHGELLDGGAPADGRYDLRVRAFARPGAKSPLATASELPGVAVVGGRFSVELDVPEDADGTTWIEVAVRASDGGDPYVALGDPQPLAKANSTCPGAWALDGNTGLPAGSFLGIADPASGTPLELRARNVAVARFTPGPGAGVDAGAALTTLGSSANAATGVGSTVGGGGATADVLGFLCPNCSNRAEARFATVAGGVGNRAAGEHATVSGGFQNRALDDYAIVAGGLRNEATALAVVGGGQFNRAAGAGSTVPGGADNRASGDLSIAPGGAFNCAGGDYSLAAGRNAVVRPGSEAGDLGCSQSGVVPPDQNGDEGTFIWADTQTAPYISTGADQFLVRARGGVGINAAPPQSAVELTITSDPDGDFPNLWLRQRAAGGPGVMFSAGNASGSNNAGFYVDHYNDAGAQSRRFSLSPDGSAFVASSTSNPNVGALLAAGSGTWSSSSDRRLKTAITSIDPDVVLERLLALPISTWSYIAQGDGVRHLGPMAQDFAAAFALGENDTTISSVDADGVALAAIQGLNAKLEAENAALRARDARLQADHRALARQLAALLRRVEALEAPAAHAASPE
jgi:hypothetical protein